MLKRVFDQHAVRWPHLQPRRNVAKHACIGLGPQVAEHGHVFDADDAIKAAAKVERSEHAQGIGSRRVGQDELAPGQLGQRRAVMRAGAQALLEAGQPVRLMQEVPRVDAVMAYQAEQGGAIVIPVVLAKLGGAVGREPELGDHVVGHRLVCLAEGGVAGVVQGVVEVEQPNTARVSGFHSGHDERISGGDWR